jgi:hypothetical protein
MTSLPNGIFILKGLKLLRTKIPMIEGGLGAEDHLVIHVTGNLIYVSAAGEPMFIKEIENENGILRPGTLIDAEQDETIRRWVLGLKTNNGSVFLFHFDPILNVLLFQKHSPN